jgi:hypothetical protein
MKQLRILIPVVCLIGLAILFFNRPPAEEKKATVGKSESVQKVQEVEVSPSIDEKMNIYLVIGEGKAAESSTEPKEAKFIDRCVRLNENKEWVPMEDGNDPEHFFVRKLLGKNKSLKIGLVTSKRENAKIEAWMDRNLPETREMRQLAKHAIQGGDFKGVLWLHGNEVIEGDVDKMKSFIGELRSHIGDPNLPFIIGMVEGSQVAQVQFVKIPESIHVAVFTSAGSTELLG